MKGKPLLRVLEGKQSCISHSSNEEDKLAFRHSSLVSVSPTGGLKPVTGSRNTRPLTNDVLQAAFT